MSKTELKIISSLAKVFPDSAPPVRTEKCLFSTLAGETVSFQVAYLHGENSRQWGVLHIEGPPFMRLNIRRVRQIQGQIPAHFKADYGYISTKEGLYPDLLEDYEKQTEAGTNRLPLTPFSWQCAWVDVSFAPSAPHGHYSVKAIIKKHDGEILAQAKTSIEYIPMSLPDLEIPRTQWFHVDCLAEYYGVKAFSERHWEIIENFASYAVEHGINTLLTPIHTPPLDTEVGGERLTVQLIEVSVESNGRKCEEWVYSFDFTKFERWVAMCKRIGVKFYEMAHLFTQWGAKHAPKIMGTVDGKYVRMFGWDTEASGPEYANYLKQMLFALTVKLREMGIADKTIFHISDEPDKEHRNAYREARKIVEPFLKDFKVVDALSNYELFKTGEVSVPVAAVDNIEPFLKGNVPELWCYYCCAQSYKVPNHFFMQPSYRNRILGTLMYKFNISGFLHWGYNFYKCMHSVYPIDPFRTTDADGTFPSGDAFMVYPGKDGKPLASLRLMVAQEAFNDYRAFLLLESKIGRAAVLELIDGDMENKLTFSCYPQNEEFLLDLRRRVNAAIYRSANFEK